MKRFSRIANPGRKTRRGVLLLVILGLLAMFSLIALTFVIVASQAKRSAIAAGRAEVFVSPEDRVAARIGWRAPPPVSGDVADPYVQFVHEAFLRLLRGVNTAAEPNNPIAFHSLLEDIYGPDSVRGTISGADLACGNALIEVSVSGVSDPWWLVGRVATVLEGPARGLSTHIVGYNPANGRLQLRTFADLPPSVSLTDLPTALQNQSVLINGAAFSGRGFVGNPTARPSSGEANEDYDAPDHQNMHLALAVPNAQVPVPIPSFHRADLVRYWRAQGNSSMERQSILRPTSTDHPNFTGSNPKFDPTWDGLYNENYAWDVDNDADGIPDSIWLDIGLPVRSSPDGRQYKPLVAILCLDLDGRLNLNAHGSLQQTTSAYSTQATLADGQLFATGTTTAELARGAGFGPADVNLLNLFNSNYTLYNRIFNGVTLPNGLSYDGRYGNTGVPGFFPLCFNKHFAYPAAWIANNLTNCKAYGTPPDIRGTMAVGLDVRGQPIYTNLLAWGGDQFTNNPYQVNLGPNTPRGLPPGTPNNNPFSPAELERILRAADADADLLPPRLAILTSTSSDGNPANSVLLARRAEITTESWDAPVAPFAFNVGNPEATSRPRHVVEALLMRYGIGTGSAAHQQLLTGRLLPPELLQGLKMDLNRPWGDGLDNNGNGVIDEIEEAGSETFPQQTVPSLPAAQTDLTQGTGIPETQARQLYARYLYCLAMTLWDLDYLDSRLGNRSATCRFIAQWAVNVVDFRDRDSIMTCFEYDPNPFTAQGWRCDGDPTTDDGISEPHVVWGCERPEVLITETLALHDRRVEDLNTDSSGKYTTDPNNPDDDFDQRLRPRGSLFVELYNPWTTNEPIHPELYGTGTEGPGVDLTRRAPGGAPVWRMVIVPYTQGATPQPDPANPNQPSAPAIERSVYFVDPGGTMYTGETADTQRYYPSTSGTTILPPGRYALLGPAEKTTKTAKNPRFTYLGIPNSTTLTASQTEADVPNNAARRIELNPTGTPPIQIQNNGAFDFPAANVKRPLVVLIDEPYRLSVTEPTDKGSDAYYPATDAGAGGSGAEYDESGSSYAGYQKPFDAPLDKNRPGNIWDTVRKDGYYPHYRVIHLQRLANPLAAYHPKANPYVTVDTAPIDLITFNGIVNDSSHADHSGGNLSYAVTRERGEWNDPNNPTVNTLWGHEPENQTPQDRGAGTQDYRLRPNLGHSLGFLNYHLNKGGSPPRRLPTRTDQYLGDPQQPFPWLTWLNRPFVDSYELMLVPAASQYELLHNYRTVIGAPNPYQPTGPNDLPFPHLANFFHSDRTPRGSSPTHNAPLLYRLFDYVGVPSPYIYTEIQVPPNNAAASTGHFFRPPFNRIPLYREPGRININTLASPGVGEALVSALPDLRDNQHRWQLWADFMTSRKGASSTITIPPGIPDEQAMLLIQEAMLTCDHNLPSRFSRPFRAWFGSYLTTAGSGGLSEPDEVESTLLRSEPGASPRRPLLENRRTVDYAHPDRNPYFRYQALQKLGNLVTTRSNVYAVWITVGYFEVDGSGKLGQELGLDRGEVRRHRAFYMIDRTIPVGFERGQDHNVEKCILLRRFIE